eukprot:1946743-Pleurochrysis_carterae.AAC.1
MNRLEAGVIIHQNQGVSTRTVDGIHEWAGDIHVNKAPGIGWRVVFARMWKACGVGFETSYTRRWMGVSQASRRVGDEGRQCFDSGGVRVQSSVHAAGGVVC